MVSQPHQRLHPRPRSLPALGGRDHFSPRRKVRTRNPSDIPVDQRVVSPGRHVEDYRPLPVSFSGITIEASTSAKLLGVVLDRKLFFREHVELAQSRGTNATLSLSRISSPTFGLPHSYVHAAAFPDHSCPGYAVRPTGVV